MLLFLVNYVLTAKFSQKQTLTKFPNFLLWNSEKEIAFCESTGRELPFEWPQHRILSADSKVTFTLQNSIKHSGSERVKSQIFFWVRGGSRILFRRGCTRLLLFFNSNKPRFFFLQNTSCIRKPQVISGGGRTPCTLPLDPPLWVRDITKISSKSQQAALPITIFWMVFAGITFKKTSNSWANIVSIRVHPLGYPCHPLQQTSGNGFSA